MQIIETLNAVRIVANESGRFAIQEQMQDGTWDETASYRYGNLHGCQVTARAMSAENDRIDSYENAHR